MKQHIADMRRRIEGVSARMVPLMGQVNYAHRLLQHVNGLERIISQLEREIEPLRKRGKLPRVQSERERQKELDAEARKLADREVERAVNGLVGEHGPDE